MIKIWFIITLLMLDDGTGVFNVKMASEEQYNTEERCHDLAPPASYNFRADYLREHPDRKADHLMFTCYGVNYDLIDKIIPPRL